MAKHTFAFSFEGHGYITVDTEQYAEAINEWGRSPRRLAEEIVYDNGIPEDADFTIAMYDIPVSVEN